MFKPMGASVLISQSERQMLNSLGHPVWSSWKVWMSFESEAKRIEPRGWTNLTGSDQQVTSGGQTCLVPDANSRREYAPCCRHDVKKPPINQSINKNSYNPIDWLLEFRRYISWGHIRMGITAFGTREYQLRTELFNLLSAWWFSLITVSNELEPMEYLVAEMETMLIMLKKIFLLLSFFSKNLN